MAFHITVRLEFFVKKSQFQQFNGRDGKPAYISYKGKIYDIGKSEHWKNGHHMSRHSAGEDLTEALSEAPHGEEVLYRIKQVEILDGDIAHSQRNNKKEKIRDLYRFFHPHPISIHFPIGTIFFGVVLQLLFLTSKISSFENAVFYAFFFGAIFELPAIASGIFSWWLNYNFALTSIFKKKLYFSAILLLVSSFIVITRFVIPDISFRADLLSSIYYISIFCSAIVVFILGFYGGKITWH